MTYELYWSITSGREFAVKSRTYDDLKATFKDLSKNPEVDYASIADSKGVIDEYQGEGQ